MLVLKIKNLYWGVNVINDEVYYTRSYKNDITPDKIVETVFTQSGTMSAWFFLTEQCLLKDMKLLGANDKQLNEVKEYLASK